MAHLILQCIFTNALKRFSLSDTIEISTAHVNYTWVHDPHARPQSVQMSKYLIDQYSALLCTLKCLLIVQGNILPQAKPTGPGLSVQAHYY